MPLPSIKVRCCAKAKSTQHQCHNPAAFDMPVCRMHGARRAHTVRKGDQHPNYQHGDETKEAKAARKDELAELRMLESKMKTAGLIK